MTIHRDHLQFTTDEQMRETIRFRLPPPIRRGPRIVPPREDPLAWIATITSTVVAAIWLVAIAWIVLAY
jgi:hypothetical protein